MKYLSVIALAVLIGLSWWLYVKKQGLSSAQQTRLQVVLQEYLGAYLAETAPNATEIQDPQVLIKVIEPGKKMQADFTFHYFETTEDGGQNKVERQGSFSLTSDNGNDWIARIEKINESEIEFAEPFAIPREKLTEAEIKAALGNDNVEPEPEPAH